MSIWKKFWHTPRLCGLLLMICLSACGATGAEQQTLVAYDALLSTQRANIYLTATVDAERGQATLDAIQSRINRAQTERQFMLSTLEAYGIDTSNLRPLNTPTPAPSSPTPADMSAETTPPEGDVPLPTPIAVTPLVITPVAPQPSPMMQVTPTTSSNLRDVVTSTGVGNDDCAVGITNRFSVNTIEIYVVARAVGISANTNLASQWQRADGTVLARFDFTPNFNIANACIWFFADQTDFPFIAGDYTVTLEVNGQVATAPIAFTIAP